MNSCTLRLPIMVLRRGFATHRGDRETPARDGAARDYYGPEPRKLFYEPVQKMIPAPCPDTRSTQ